MKLGRLNHVGVATPSIERSVETYRALLGATAVGELFDLPAQGVRVCFVDAPNTQVELIEPLDDKSPIAGFLAKNPAGGQHHLCFGRQPALFPSLLVFSPRKDVVISTGYAPPCTSRKNA